MVINRGDIKRKRREFNNAGPQLSAASTKRAKVHAQRKFAQGSSLNSPVVTPVKEIERIVKASSIETVAMQPEELLPVAASKRPNTEDFLTFLCFRGTTALPSKLDYFSLATANGAATPEDPHLLKEEQHLANSHNSHSSKSNEVSPSQPSEERPFVAFGVRKRADPFAACKPAQRAQRHAMAVQALRRKYQEQKMARLRAIAFRKIGQDDDRNNVIRTRSVAKNETFTIPGKNKKIKVVRRVQITTTTTTKIKQPQKMCLRSRGHFVHRELLTVNRKKVVIKSKVPLAAAKTKTKAQKPITPPKQQKPQKPPEKPKSVEKPKQKPIQPQLKNVKNLKQPKPNVDLKSKQKVAQKPPKQAPEVKKMEKKPSEQVKKQPDATPEPKAKTSPVKEPVKVVKKTPRAAYSTRSSKGQEGVIFFSDFSSEDDEPLVKRSKSIRPQLQATPYKVEKKKKVKKELTPAIGTRSTKLEEVVVSPCRPTRKTKEAAALYMELLGRKLVQDDADLDEDNGSIDSFPELPNVRRTEQRENELKAKIQPKNKVGEVDAEEVRVTRSSTEHAKLCAAQSKPKAVKLEPKTAEKPPVKTQSNSLKPVSVKLEPLVRQPNKLPPKKKPLPAEEVKPESPNVILPSRLRSDAHCRHPVDAFNDSDEEPLAKLTTDKTVAKKTAKLPRPAAVVERTPDRKPPQYPSFTSLDDEKAFRGFNEAKRSTPEDIICPDHFGKAKVNMSNEQIEKWLNDSALIQASSKKELFEDVVVKEEPQPQQPKHQQQLLLPPSIKRQLDFGCKKQGEAKAEKTALPEQQRRAIFQKRGRPAASLSGADSKAFSPSNESSVYAFEADNEAPLNTTPFRSSSRRPSSAATSRSGDESGRAEEEDRAKRVTPGKFRVPPVFRSEAIKANVKQEVSLTLSTDESDGASIAVRLDCNEEALTTDGADAGDEDGQLFYIPLTGSKQTSPDKPVIQGVAVKLGTAGPNQQVVVRAKLVTKTPPELVKAPIKVEDSGKKVAKEKKKGPNQPAAAASASSASCGTANRIVEAPVFRPTEKEFQDPMVYIEKIRPEAEKYGICRIVPPSNFKPECKVSDDMRFTAYNQYVHKMLHRFGPNFRELLAIKKYLKTQSISLTRLPQIGGMEVDLPRLYQTVQMLGGLKEVIEKKRWPKVAEGMKIPKSAQDRVTKLDDIYCKYLLPYETLSFAEREKLFKEVETEWENRETRNRLDSEQILDETSANNNSDDDGDEEEEEEEEEDEEDDDLDECIVRGKTMPLNTFYRIARNTLSMWFRSAEPGAEEVEHDFWKHLATRQSHICVHSGSIDSGGWGYGFACSKNSPLARHGWNLKVLTNNQASVLRSMGPVMGVTVPTLHVGMVFSACCWYRDPHGLPWVEYLHTGAKKIWYGIPDSCNGLFRATLSELFPQYCRDQTLWLPSDTAMVPPSLLVERGLTLCRTVQQPGQFIVVFPKAFTSSLCTGYVVSESVFFATRTWLQTAAEVFRDLRSSCEPSMFSLEKLLLSIAADARAGPEVLRQVLPSIVQVRNREARLRGRLEALGLKGAEKLPLPDAGKGKKKQAQEDEEYECDVCRMNLHVSMVNDSQEECYFCLDHAAERLEKKKALLKHCKLVYTYEIDGLDRLIEKVNAAIEAKSQKKTFNKYAGMPTLLTG